ncbi:MAG: hypothetical protein AAFX03_02185 [Pseudomonadota bacterium]
MGLRTFTIAAIAPLIAACGAPDMMSEAPDTPPDETTSAEPEPMPQPGPGGDVDEEAPADQVEAELSEEREPPASAQTCRAADLGLQEFPWPPPQPSTDVTIPRGLVTLGMAGEAATLTSVADRLDAALLAAGYVEFSYFGVGCDGFALITRLEQIDAQGNPVEDGERFAPPDQAEPPSLTGFIQRLFRAPPGYYRQIAFVATARTFEETAPPPEEDELRDLVDSGAAALPEEMDRAAFTRAHRVIALIYEFEKRDAEEDVMQLTPSRVSGSVHLERAGIYDGFETDG